MMPYLSCKKIENDVYNFPTWQYCKYKDIFDSRIIINSTAKFYISISYQKDLLSIDTRIFTPSRYILRISFLNTHLLALRTRSIPRSKELGQFRFFHVKKDVPFCVIGHSREFPITREIALSSQFTHYANCNPISHNLIISQLYYLRLSIYSQILSSNRQNGQRLPIH